MAQICGVMMYYHLKVLSSDDSRLHMPVEWNFALGLVAVNLHFHTWKSSVVTGNKYNAESYVPDRKSVV